MNQAARCILNSTEFDAVIAAQLPIAKTLTNGLIELAWESVNIVPDGAERLSGLVLKRMLARLVAAAWRGAAAPAQLDVATAERVGKRLQKQVDVKLKGWLGAASSKATRARSALSKASAEEGVELLAARMAAIDAQEREECTQARRARYEGFTELDDAEGGPKVAEVADAAAEVVEPGEPATESPSLRPSWEELSQQLEREEAAAEKAALDELADEAAFQLKQGGGIPRALSRELGTHGCAAVMKYLKANGGVGLVPDPGMAGAYLMVKQGKDVSVTWEEALRHELPFILGAHMEQSQGV